MKLGQLSAKIKRSCSEKSDFSTEVVLHKSECMACVCQNLKSWTKKMAKNTPHNTAPCHPPPPPLLSILHCEYKCSLQPRPRPVILHPRYLQSCQHQEDIFANSLSYISKQTGNIRKETGTRRAEALLVSSNILETNTGATRRFVFFRFWVFVHFFPKN